MGFEVRGHILGSDIGAILSLGVRSRYHERSVGRWSRRVWAGFLDDHHLNQRRTDFDRRQSSAGVETARFGILLIRAHANTLQQKTDRHSDSLLKVNAEICARHHVSPGRADPGHN